MRLQSTLCSTTGLLLDALWLDWAMQRDTSGMEMAGLQGELPKWLKDTPSIRAAVKEIADTTGKKVVGVMVNRLPAGVTIPPHTDEDIGQQRYHLPLQTNADVRWWDEESGEVVMEEGTWYGPVPFAVKHGGWNKGTKSRFHLVVDVA